jgi:serine-type D-Ala-D-Ala carboxypeptidase (penicillin-binding protein 5/6)
MASDEHHRQEASVAGESPDKSERERSSGETTEDPGRVPSARQVSADAEGTEGAEGADRDARLRAAVAAWVAADGTEAADGAQGAGADDDEPHHADDAPAPQNGDEAPTAGGLPVRRPARSADGDADAASDADEPETSGDQPTTMFGVVRGEAVGSKDTVHAAERAERMTSAFFGAARRRDDDEGTPPSERTAGDPPADPTPGPADDSPEPEPTASAEAESPAPAGAGAADAASARGAAEPDSQPAADGPPEPDQSEPGQSDSGEADSGEAEESAAEGGDQDTAMLRIPKDQPTTAIRFPGKADGKETGGDSRFVPLRSPDDAPRRVAAAALPPEKPASPPPPPSGDASLSGTERTRQQPLPGEEPLDLLAQLTNTPPPPQTPLRTVARRFKIWTPLVVLLGIVFVIAQALRPLPDPSLTLTASQTYTFGGAKPALPWPSEGQAYIDVAGLGVLGTFGKPKPVPIGSVAKTMTAYLVLKKSPLSKGENGPMITVDAKAEEGGTHGQGNGGESVLDTVHAGDKISERDALSAMMIPSANNIARLLARWYTGGSEAKFVKKMNETADALGMHHTTYTDPSGLQHTTVSTAEDQVKLGRKVVEMPELMKITSEPTWTDPSGKTWRNWNHLVPYDGAIGIKTGTTTAAGGNLLFAGRKNIGGTTQVIVGAVLGQHKPPIIDTVVAASRKLLVAAGDTLQTKTVVHKGQVVGYVDDQLGGRTPVVATKDVTAVGWAGLRVPLALETGDQPVPHTAKAGDTVGVLTVGDGPGQVRVPVALQKDLTEPGFGDKLTRVL